MKKLIVLSVLLVLTFSCSDNLQLPEDIACDNGTFVGHVTLRTQQDVNDFGALCYTKIDGTLALFDKQELIDNITDLSPLINIREITSQTYGDSLTGSLYIETKNLTSLAGLENVTNVARLRILNNESLINLIGLEGLITIEGENYGNNALQIIGNPNLVSLQGLNSLQTIGRNGYGSGLFISNNLVLQNINGLNSLTRIGDPNVPGDFNSPSIWIHGNEELQNLNGFESLMEVNGPLHFLFFNDTPFFISGNDALGDWCGLQNLFTNGVYGNLRNTSNLYDGYTPTTQDIIAGNCAQ